MSRSAFASWCVEQVGKPSLWGAKGPDAFDCSGLVTCGYFAAGLKDWRQTHNAQSLFDGLEETKEPDIGDLAFYGLATSGIAKHVVVILAGGIIIGASGATPSVKKISQAIAVGAVVKIRANHLYRHDFIGFRKSPFKEEEEKYG